MMNTVSHEDIDRLAPGDHVAVLYRETADFEKVTNIILDQCTRKRWCPLYISRPPPGECRNGAKGG